MTDDSVSAPTTESAEVMYSGEFAIHRSDNDGIRRVNLAGELDLATAPDLAAALAQIADHEHLVVDTTELQFIDSTGLGALVEARQRLGERFRLIPGQPCRRVIQLTGLQEFFGVE